MIKQACIDIPSGNLCGGCIFCNYNMMGKFICGLFEIELNPNSITKCKECLDKYGE